MKVSSVSISEWGAQSSETTRIHREWISREGNKEKVRILLSSLRIHSLSQNNNYFSCIAANCNGVIWPLSLGCLEGRNRSFLTNCFQLLSKTIFLSISLSLSAKVTAFSLSLSLSLSLYANVTDTYDRGTKNKTWFCSWQKVWRQKHKDAAERKVDEGTSCLLFFGFKNSNELVCAV